MRAFDAACARQWAITEDALQTILEIAARENPSIEAVEQRLGRALDNSHTVTVLDGVATIPINGPIFRYANLFSAISGATSVEVLAQDLRQALDDPAIVGIVLAIDSPGGEVSGIHEFADQVYAARDKKPIVAFIDDFGASAAYWIASAADRVLISATATVGSIGVVSAVRDPTSRSSGKIEFVSSQSPNKRLDPTTDAGKSKMQTIVDDIASVFVASVARNRGVSEATVLADFGQGGVFIGQHAVTAGLADSVGSQEQAVTLARTQKPLAPPTPLRAGKSAARVAAAHVTGGAVPQRRMAGMSTFATFKHWLTQGREGREIARAAGADLPEETTFTAVEFEAEEARKAAAVTENTKLKAERDALEKERDEARREKFAAMSQRMEAEAAGYVDGLITGGTVLPRERESLIATYRQSALDDAQYGTVGAEGGTPTSRVEQFKRTCADRAPLKLTGEQIRVSKEGGVVQGQTAGPEEDGVLTEAEKVKLMALTPAGRTALEKKAK